MSIYLGKSKINFIDKIIVDDSLKFENFMKRKLITIDNNDLKGIEYIRPYAFYKNEDLISIYLPTTLKEIGYYAFGECINLKEVNCNAIIPPSFNNEDNYCFGNNVEIIYIPKGTIDSYTSVSGWSKYKDKLIERDGV